MTADIYVIPAGWFIAFEPAGALFMGVYEGRQLRLVGTRQIQFENLTEEIIQRQFESALSELASA